MPSPEAMALRIMLAPREVWTGDIAGNAATIRSGRAAAAREQADLVVFGALALSGPHPGALAQMPAFSDACRAALEALARETADGGPAMIVGTPWIEEGRCYEALAVLERGRIEAVRLRATAAGRDDPFALGPLPGPVGFRGLRMGLLAGSDLANPDVAECLVETGADVLVGVQDGTYRRGLMEQRLQQAVARVAESGLPLLLVAGLGGNGEQACVGGSFVLNADRALALQVPACVEASVTSLWTRGADWSCAPAARALWPEGAGADYAACVAGLRAYVAASGAEAVSVRADRGRASLLTALLAADALGAAHVHGTGDSDGLLAPLGLAQGQDDAALPLGAEAAAALWLQAEANVFYPLADCSSVDVEAWLALRGRWRAPGARGPDPAIVAAISLPIDAPIAIPVTRAKVLMAAPRAVEAIGQGLIAHARVSDLIGQGHDPVLVRALANLFYTGAPGIAPLGTRLLPEAERVPVFPRAHRFRDTGAPAHQPDATIAPRRPTGSSERFED